MRASTFWYAHNQLCNNGNGGHFTCILCIVGSAVIKMVTSDSTKCTFNFTYILHAQSIPTGHRSREGARRVAAKNEHFNVIRTSTFRVIMVAFVLSQRSDTALSIHGLGITIQRQWHRRRHCPICDGPCSMVDVLPYHISASSHSVFCFLFIIKFSVSDHILLCKQRQWSIIVILWRPGWRTMRRELCIFPTLCAMVKWRTDVCFLMFSTLVLHSIFLLQRHAYISIYFVLFVISSLLIYV